MTTMQRFPEGLGFACLALLLALPFTCAASTTVSDWQSMLQGAGYATETPEQIIEAYNSEKDWFTRIVALELLVQRVGIRAIPALSNALDDAQVEVRHKAAELLHRLGDDGGLVQMQYDFDLLSYKCGYVPRDAKPEELEGVQVNRGQYSFEWGEVYYRRKALEVAKLLALMGDCRGFEMAATVALEGKLAIQRTDAILALGRMAAADEAALRAEGIDPVTVLCAVAESETDVVPFRILRSVASKLDKDRATRVLQVAASNPFQAERYQELLQRQLESLQSNEESSCAD